MALALSVPSIPVPAAAQNFDPNAAETNTGPSLGGRLGEIAGGVYDKAQTSLVAPARQATEQLLADPQTEKIYQHLSETAQDLAGLADTHVVQPIARVSRRLIDELADRLQIQRSFGAVGAIAGDLMEMLRLRILDPLIAGLKHAAEGEITAPPAPGSATLHLSVDLAADPFRQAVAIPGLPDSDILRNQNDSDPLEPFNRLMFRLNGGLQGNLLDPVSRLYVANTSAGVQDGIGNFFRNLREPATFVSSALEGQFDDASAAAARFGINTTLGIAGFRDRATELGFTVRPRNLEETLCIYGLPSGPYLVLPVLGPATLRDTAGRIATVVMYFEVMGTPIYVTYRISDIILQYSNVKDRMNPMNELSTDPYTAQKMLYLGLRDLSCGQQAVAYREFFTK